MPSWMGLPSGCFDLELIYEHGIQFRDRVKRNEAGGELRPGEAFWNDQSRHRHDTWGLLAWSGAVWRRLTLEPIMLSRCALRSHFVKLLSSKGNCGIIGASTISQRTEYGGHTAAAVWGRNANAKVWRPQSPLRSKALPGRSKRSRAKR